MTAADMAHVRNAFVAAARRSQRIGIEAIKLHAALAQMYKLRWPLEAPAALGATVPAGPQHWRVLLREAQKVFGDLRVGQR